MGSVNTCSRWFLETGMWDKVVLMVVCVFEPVVLGLDKRKTAFSEVDFTQPPQVDKGLQSFLCLHVNT